MNKNEILEKQLKDLTTHLQQVLKPAHQFDLHTNNIKNILESTFQQFELNKTWHHLQDTLDKVNKWNALMLSTLKFYND